MEKRERKTIKTTPIILDKIFGGNVVDRIDFFYRFLGGVQNILFGLGMATILCISALYNVSIRCKINKIRKISNLIKDFIRKNNLYQSHYIIKHTLFGDKEVELIEYYPQVTYTENASGNVFCIKFR